MAITVADNFSYQGKKPLDGRDGFDTLAQMKAYPEASVYDGCMTYCKEDEKYYTFKASNTVDITTGKWREFETGGGGGHTIQDDGVDMTARDNLNFVGFNVTDDSTNNRTTVAFPSVDLSMLSNEAFILSATEKAVGMDTDGKLLYAKTISKTISNTNTSFVNFDSLPSVKVRGFFGTLTTSDGTQIMPADYSAYNIYVAYQYTNDYIQYVTSNSAWLNNSTVKLTVIYTKTTDSPLPAGVKFAGVTAGGDIVLKKTVSTGGSVPSGGTLLYRLPLLNGTDIVYYTT